VNAGAVAAGNPVSEVTAPVGLTPTPVKYGNYTAKPGDFVIVQTSASNTVTITMPAGAATGSLVGVKLLNTGFPVNVQASGADVFDALPAGTTELTLNTAGATFIAQYRSANTTWYIQSASYAEPSPIYLGQTGISNIPGTPAANSALPADLGFVTWSYDPASLNSPLPGTALASGVIYLVQCPVRATALLTNVFAAWITSAGSGLTTGQNFAGVYDAGGNRLAASADMTTAFTASGAFTFGLSGVTVTPPFVWAAFLSNGTTPPSFARTLNQAGLLANGNLASPNGRFATVSGTHTGLPSTFNTNLISNAAAAYFVGLS
jgi:hypothetical protein